jgi:hypothetical protein
MPDKRITIGVSEGTHRRLTKLGVYGESMDDIVRKCVDCYEREQVKGSKK